MDWLTFFSETIKSLSWPVSVVIVAIIYRKQLPSLLSSIKKVKAGGLEIERLEKVAEAVESKFVEKDEGDDEIEIFLSKEEKQVLLAVINSQFTMRSITGVAKDTGLNKMVVNETYSKLIAKGLLEQTHNSEGKLRWYPTNMGRKLLATAS